MKHQSAQKDWLIMPVHNLPTLSRRTRLKLQYHKILLLGDLIRLCVDKRGEFTPIDLKGFGLATNYDIAKLLLRRKFISEVSFGKVRTPARIFRKPTDKEIGEGGDLLISEFYWSESARVVIKHTCNIRRRGQWKYRAKEWSEITIRDLAKRFIRMTKEDKTLFWTTGHYGSHWYSRDDLLIDAFRECLSEIERFLFEHHFLESVNKPAQEES